MHAVADHAEQQFGVESEWSESAHSKPAAAAAAHVASARLSPAVAVAHAAERARPTATVIGKAESDADPAEAEPEAAMPTGSLRGERARAPLTGRLGTAVHMSKQVCIDLPVALARLSFRHGVHTCALLTEFWWSICLVWLALVRYLPFGPLIRLRALPFFECQDSFFRLLCSFFRLLCSETFVSILPATARLLQVSIRLLLSTPMRVRRFLTCASTAANSESLAALRHQLCHALLCRRSAYVRFSSRRRCLYASRCTAGRILKLYGPIGPLLAPITPKPLS
jgi:hypothetical protein